MKWISSLMRLNSLLVAVFGIGIVSILGKVFQYVVKIYHEKRKENDRQKKFLHGLAISDKNQEKRLEELEKYQKSSDERAKNMIKAQKASLHNQLWNKAEVYLNRGYVTVGELNNFEYLYRAYKGTGGNHTGDVLYEKVKALPVKDEGILNRKDVVKCN